MNQTNISKKASPLRGGLEGSLGSSLVFLLTRTNINAKTCDGKLYAEDGTYICDTAEATPYMIERGEYTLARKSRLIQKGNGVYALRKSTIFVGTYLVPGVVKCSAQAYERLYQRIKKARQRGRKVVLVVE